MLCVSYSINPPRVGPECLRLSPPVVPAEDARPLPGGELRRPAGKLCARTWDGKTLKFYNLKTKHMLKTKILI